MSFAELKSTKKTKSYVQSFVTRSDISASGERSSESLLGHEQDGEASSGSEKVISEAGMYSVLPDLVEIRHSAVNGRGIWTKSKSPIRAGSVLFITKPFASALSTPNLSSFCSSCFAPSSINGSRQCTKCRIAHYCDSNCQTNDWAIHKLECTSLQKWFQVAPSSDIPPPSDAVRCLSRMLWKIQKLEKNAVQAREIANMQSHRQSLKPSAYETHTYLAHSLVQYMGLSSPADMAQYSFSSAADLVDTISRFVTNTFTITDPTLIPLGASVSPVVALLNHSCDPNAVVVFPRVSPNAKIQEPSMQVIAIRDIYPDEELYADNLLLRCAKCNSIIQSVDAALDARRVGQEGLDKASSLQIQDPGKSIQLTTNLIPILTSAGFSSSSHPLLGLTRLHQQLLTASFPDPLTQEHLDETIRTATKNVGGLAALLREGHPILALALAELGKLLAVDEPSPRVASDQMSAAMYPPSGLPRLKLAYETLLSARKMLLIGFGVTNEGGQVGREVREMIVALEKEIGVFRQGVRNVLEDKPKLKTQGMH